MLWRKVQQTINQPKKRKDDAMKTMTPSAENVGMTDGQIDKAADALRSAFVARLREHRSEFGVDATQQALGAKGLIPDMFAVFRGYVERFSNLIVRLVRPNRTQSPQAALDATGRKQYTTASVVASMPRGTGDEAKIVFFKPDESAYDENGWINDDNVEKQYTLRGLKPADPYSLAKANEDDPDFADEHPNATHWKDAEGKWCFAAFRRWLDDERVVSVYRRGRGWDDDWLFAGLAISPEE